MLKIASFMLQIGYIPYTKLCRICKINQTQKCEKLSKILCFGDEVKLQDGWNGFEECYLDNLD